MQKHANDDIEQLADGYVAGVCASVAHGFSKQPAATIRLIAGEGVEGDAHRGVMVKHRSRVAADPTQPNLRQVHLIPAELFDDVDEQGFAIGIGDLGENITTEEIDLLDLPKGTILAIGEARIEITGLRNPCAQIDAFRKGLLAAVLDKAPDGTLIRKAGIMGIVLAGGEISPGDEIFVTLPPEPHVKLERV
ncbi:MAG: MOSC domain-containing protein [Bosea sp. (in: a-proteobacteria)]